MNKWLERMWSSKSDRVIISVRYRGSQLAWVVLPTPADGFTPKFDCEKYEYMINV